MSIPIQQKQPDCTCKICREGLRDYVASLVAIATPNTSIRSQLKAKGVSVTSKLLERHLAVTVYADQELEPSQPETQPAATQRGGKSKSRIKELIESRAASKAASAPDIVPVEPVVTRYDASRLNSLDLSAYDFDASDPADIVRYLQQKQIALYLNQIQIVAHQQEQYLTGKSKHAPSSSITHLKSLQEMVNRITGMSVYANQQAAIATVQRMGLRVQEFAALAPEGTLKPISESKPVEAETVNLERTDL